MANIKDLSGQRFGRLTVIQRADVRDQRGKPLWRCLCDCGEECLVGTRQLTSGNTRSCGCLRKEIRQRDITGQRFGRLVAVECTGQMDTSVKGHHSYIWKFRCDCGKECVFPLRALSGGRRSCGCLELETKGNQARQMQERIVRTEGTNVSIISKPTVYRNNTSGVRGVHWVSRLQKWRAVIDFQGKRYELGVYSDLQEAARARQEAEELTFGAFLEWYKNMQEETK